eukprot:SAG31_NODE_203_length_20490_cov_7.713256_18_plen_256_part_00
MIVVHRQVVDVDTSRYGTQRSEDIVRPLKTDEEAQLDGAQYAREETAVVFTSMTWTPSGDFFPCVRVPTAVHLPGTGTVLAFAELRRWVGDGCCPVACCGPDATNVSCPVPKGQPKCSGGCQIASEGVGGLEINSVDTTDRYVGLRISTDNGQSFGELQPNITGMQSNNPASLVSADGREVFLFFNDARKNCTAEIARGIACGGVWLTRSSTVVPGRVYRWEKPRKIFPNMPCPRGRFCDVPSIVSAGSIVSADA